MSSSVEDVLDLSGIKRLKANGGATGVQVLKDPGRQTGQICSVCNSKGLKEGDEFCSLECKVSFASAARFENFITRRQIRVHFYDFQLPESGNNLQNRAKPRELGTLRCITAHKNEQCKSRNMPGLAWLLFSDFQQTFSE
jgi:hypothetical protein